MGLGMLVRIKFRVRFSRVVVFVIIEFSCGLGTGLVFIGLSFDYQDSVLWNLTGREGYFVGPRWAGKEMALCV